MGLPSADNILVLFAFSRLSREAKCAGNSELHLCLKTRQKWNYSLLLPSSRLPDLFIYFKIMCTSTDCLVWTAVTVPPSSFFFLFLNRAMHIMNFAHNLKLEATALDTVQKSHLFLLNCFKSNDLSYTKWYAHRNDRVSFSWAALVPLFWVPSGDMLWKLDRLT